MDVLAVAAGLAEQALVFFTEAGGGAEGGEGAGGEPAFQINVFWIITQAASFLLFLVILYLAAFRRIGGVLETRRQQIEQGLRDAEAARREREQASQERAGIVNQARQEANEIVSRAQRSAEEVRERDLAEARSEIERIRNQAREEIEAEKQRALGEIRGEVADLAIRAASRVVGETMNGDRERRLVEEFLRDVGEDGLSGDGTGRHRARGSATAVTDG